MEQNQKEHENAVKTKFPKTAAIIIVALLAFSVYSLARISSLNKELAQVNKPAQSENPKQKNLAFALMFIDKVLESDKEVDFETRLELENSVRGLNDKDILLQWQKFTSAKNESDAQGEVKNLLRLVIQKAQAN